MVRDHLPVKSHEPDASEKDYWAGWSEVLTPEGQWVAAPDGSVIKPVWELPQRMVHVLADATGLLAPIEMAKALEDLCARIVAEMAIKMGKAES